MAQTVLMPQLGESVTEGTIGQWLKKVGDSVDKYESLLEVLTDKVNAEVPAPIAGKIAKILVEEGQTVPIGTPICEIEVEGGQAEEAPSQNTEPATEPTPESPKDEAKTLTAPVEDGQRGRYSPAVRRLAAEHGIDPGSIAGTGAGGRVTRDDVLSASQPPTPKASTKPQAAAPQAVSSSATMMAGAPAVIDDEDTIEPF